MTYQTPQSKGGQVTAIRSRQIALKKYYTNPNYCLNCQKIIDVSPDKKVREVRRKKFCNRKCANSYNNKKYILIYLYIECILKYVK